MPDPVCLSEQKLKTHVREMQDILGKHAYPGNKIRLDLDGYGSPVTVAVGRTDYSEEVDRLRGGTAQVVRLCSVRSDHLAAWFGAHEEWERRARGADLFFRGISLTVHIGYQYSRNKPQVFRIEWSCHPDDVGQPHWQFDVLESAGQAADDADIYRKVLASEATQYDAGDFLTAPPDAEDVNVIVRRLKLSRVHFASAAAWWMPGATHTHAPSKAIDIERWVDAALTYVRSELRRL